MRLKSPTFLGGFLTITQTHFVALAKKSKIFVYKDKNWCFSTVCSELDNPGSSKMQPPFPASPCFPGFLLGLAQVGNWRDSAHLLEATDA